LDFHAYVNEIYGSRRKIPSKNLVRQRCGEGFNSGVKALQVVRKITADKAEISRITGENANR
jgi:hypothetical protein